MTDMIWNDSRYGKDVHMNAGNKSLNERQSIQFSNTQSNVKNIVNSNNNQPNEVTSASSGFSTGMKRDIASIVTANVSEKRQCVVIHDSSMKINSLLDLETNNSKQTMSVSSVSGLTPITDNTTSPSIIQCSDNWIQMQQNVKLEEKQNKKGIETYVKDHLFKDLKFIPSQEMMLFSNQEHSLNYLVCHKLNIRVEEHQSFWSKYSRYVEKAMNAARNDAVSAVKNSFLKGKSNLDYST